MQPQRKEQSGPLGGGGRATTSHASEASSTPNFIPSFPALFLLTLTPSGTTKNIKHFTPVTTL